MKLKKTFASVLFFALAICAYGQNANRFPVWTYHKKNVNIHGISVGLGSSIESERNTNTNGIKLELIGLGLFVPFQPEYPDFKNGYSERINGLSLSAMGTVCDCLTNGLSVGAIAQTNNRVNGISATMYTNITDKQNGIMAAFGNVSDVMNGIQLGGFNNSSEAHGVQLSFLVNFSAETRGLQIGAFNISDNLRGVQIGLWNVNQKRKLPLINWNFKRN